MRAELVYLQPECLLPSDIKGRIKMKIVVATDSFKGSLTAERACRIIADAIGSAAPGVEIVVKPMADGGEGTASAIMAASGRGRWIKKTVTGPLSDMRVEAGFVWFADENKALVEMAAASGLELLKPDRRNPLKTTTHGTGQLIASAIHHNAAKIFLAVGGSATVDGGVGAAVALGWRFLDKKGQEVGPGGGQLHKISTIVPPTQPIRAEVEVLCDVDNPLCGENGAAKVYGPQKGATEKMVELLDAGLAHLAELVSKQLGVDIKDIPGAGAAGGLAAGAMAFMGGKLIPGIEFVMAQSRLDEAVAGTDWVITGEGRFDHQSLRGKVVSGVVKKAKDAGAKVAVLAGQVLLASAEYRKTGIEEAIGGMNSQMTLQYAIENAEKLLLEAAKKFAAAHLL